MSESIGKPWIESSVVEKLVDHAHELPSPTQLQGRAQIVKFLTFREDTGDGKQPKDRDTVLWAEITDSECIIPVRIANDATNKFEDEYKRALTYYRRGFFTLKAVVSFDFVITQAGNQMKSSPLKQLYLDILELRYISGGGEGAPVATRATALQTPPAFGKWVAALRTGGQTLTRVQTEEKFLRDLTRTSKANSRRSNATNASKRSSKAPVKTSAQSVTPQSSIGNLAAKREWQEGWFGKRHEFHGVNYIPRSDGFEPTADQQAAFEVILERIKIATPTHPYDPMNTSNNSSVPDRFGGPSTSNLRSTQAIRPSQVISSTPIDAHPQRNQRTGPQLRISEPDEPNKRSSDAESNEESDSDYDAPIRSRQTSNRTDRTGQIPTPRPSDTYADESHQEASRVAVEDQTRLLEADDAATEQVLSQADPFVSGNQRKAPTVLVPDSDPPNSSQRSTQVRHSSPWDCEDDLPSERDISYSPEKTRNNPTKGKRRHSPTLSLPTRSILDATHDESTGSQHLGQVAGSAKQQPISGRGDSQNSAATFLPSPPPEDSKGQKTMMQNLETALSRRADEPVSPTLTLPHSRITILQHTSKNGLNEQQEEPFETRLVDNPTSRKRRLSQSQPDDTPDVQLSQELASSAGGRPITENKRRRLDVPQSKNAPHQLKVTREGLTNASTVSSDMTKPRTSNNGSGDIIPHDHGAWANPSWMNNGPISNKTVSVNPLHAADVRCLDKPQSRRISQARTRLHILQPPFHHPTRMSECTRPPKYPPITSSQFADADEDSLAPMGNSKIALPIAMQPTNKPAGSASRISNTVQSKPIIRGQRVVSAPGISKQLHTSGGNGNDTGMAQESERTARHGGRTSQEQRKEEKNRRLTVQFPVPDSRRINGKVRLDDSAINTAQSATTAHQPYLGGFQPSITVDLPRKYQWTWENWLKVTKDAYSFWLD
ncbi:unnamed protein product [Rhizoctonia solani]|uniref:Uncharacterized protein n=1 Tax=Rhizoctonia solani TaxID=456999 RepID=A0A8H3AIJ1_9AGAM|nr:unnamed protein product [Rhizoctonia solani]